jgi:hypothetical protein
MKKHLFNRISRADIKVVAFSSLFAFAAAGAPALAQQQPGGAQQDRAAVQQDRDMPRTQQRDTMQQDRAAGQPRQDEDQARGNGGVFGGDDQLRPGADISEMTVGALNGAEVINARGEVIGKVSDIVISRQDEKPHAVIDVGGWLGIGGTSIAVPLEELEIASEDQVAYNTDATQEQIEEQAGDYDEDQYVSHGDDDMRLSVYMGQQRRGEGDRAQLQVGQADDADQAAQPQADGDDDQARVVVTRPDDDDDDDDDDDQQAQAQPGQRAAD